MASISRPGATLVTILGCATIQETPEPKRAETAAPTSIYIPVGEHSRWTPASHDGLYVGHSDGQLYSVGSAWGPPTGEMSGKALSLAQERSQLYITREAQRLLLPSEDENPALAIIPTARHHDGEKWIVCTRYKVFATRGSLPELREITADVIQAVRRENKYISCRR